MCLWVFFFPFGLFFFADARTVLPHIGFAFLYSEAQLAAAHPTIGIHTGAGDAATLYIFG
jgi:hypothetical protein